MLFVQRLAFYTQIYTGLQASPSQSSVTLQIVAGIVCVTNHGIKALERFNIKVIPNALKKDIRSCLELCKYTQNKNAFSGGIWSCISISTG